MLTKRRSMTPHAGSLYYIAGNTKKMRSPKSSICLATAQRVSLCLSKHGAMRDAHCDRDGDCHDEWIPGVEQPEDREGEGCREQGAAAMMPSRMTDRDSPSFDVA